jgi:pantoate--beta-alanine ligase
VEVIRSIALVRKACDAARSANQAVGFVPTMGAFHGGHRSLMTRARAERDMVAVSIFVNPLQFGPSEDFAEYPRDEDRDLGVAEALGVDVVFAPSVDEMYPGGAPEVTVDPGPLGARLEGASRPDHFRGVASVLAVLFNAVGPCSAYFGEKDAQQVAVIRAMVHDLAFAVDVIECPTIREADGLAMSSRNAYLTEEEREAAGSLFLALTEAAEMVRSGERDTTKLIAAMAREIGATPEARIDYASVVDQDTFEEVPAVARPSRALVAARFGRTRLIDNLLLPTP